MFFILCHVFVNPLFSISLCLSSPRSERSVLVAHRAVQERWTHYSRSPEGGSVLRHLNGVSCSGTQQQAGAGHSGTQTGVCEFKMCFMSAIWATWEFIFLKKKKLVSLSQFYLYLYNLYNILSPLLIRMRKTNFCYLHRPQQRRCTTSFLRHLPWIATPSPRAGHPPPGPAEPPSRQTCERAWPKRMTPSERCVLKFSEVVMEPYREQRNVTCTQISVFSLSTDLVSTVTGLSTSCSDLIIWEIWFT